MALHAFVFLLVVCLLLSLARLGRLCWFPLRLSSSRGGAKRTMLHRLLVPRSPDDCPACRLASTPSSSAEPAPAPVRPWYEVKSRRGAPKRIDTQGFACPNQPIRRDHRCSDPRAGRRWQAWPRRAHPDLSLSGLPHQVQCPTQHPFVSSENSLSADRNGALCAGRRAGCFCRRTGLRLPTSRHHHLAHPSWRARADLTRALLLQSPPPAPAIG